MNPAEQINSFLYQVIAGKTGQIDEEIVQEFGELCKDTLRKLTRPSDKFRIRISNIGYAARNLWLDYTHGRETLSTESLVKLTYGNLVEHLLYSLAKASGVQIVEKSKQTLLKINDTTIGGEWDLCILQNNQKVLIDIKSASSYSYKYKFNNFQTIKNQDDFGYIGQAVGYSQAEGVPWGGWLVIDKSTGEIKFVDGTEANSETIVKEYLQKFQYNIDVVNGRLPPPECEGETPETYYGKETGNKYLGDACKWCNHKYKCHSNLRYLPSLASKAKEPEYKYYTNIKGEENDNSNSQIL